MPLAVAGQEIDIAAEGLHLIDLHLPDEVPVFFAEAPHRLDVVEGHYRDSDEAAFQRRLEVRAALDKQVIAGRKRSLAQIEAREEGGVLNPAIGKVLRSDRGSATRHIKHCRFHLESSSHASKIFIRRSLEPACPWSAAVAVQIASEP